MLIDFVFFYTTTTNAHVDIRRAKYCKLYMMIEECDERPKHALALKGSPTGEPPQPPQEEIDIDLDDPATEDAALKIQAAFRGNPLRKKSGDSIQSSRESDHL